MEGQGQAWSRFHSTWYIRVSITMGTIDMHGLVSGWGEQGRGQALKRFW